MTTIFKNLINYFFFLMTAHSKHEKYCIFSSLLAKKSIIPDMIFVVGISTLWISLYYWKIYNMTRWCGLSTKLFFLSQDRSFQTWKTLHFLFPHSQKKSIVLDMIFVCDISTILVNIFVPLKNNMTGWCGLSLSNRRSKLLSCI